MPRAIRRTVSAIIAALLATCACTTLPAADYPPQVGQPHPDVLLPNIEDRAPVALSQFRGKKLLLIQFASW